MKKLLVLFLLAAMLCLTGCVGNIENPENLATSDVLQVRIENVKMGITAGGVLGEIPVFSGEEMAACRRVVFFGEAEIFSGETSVFVPAEKLSVHSVKIEADAKKSYIIINVPYEGLELGKEYSVELFNVKIALEGDTPVTEEQAVSLNGSVPAFRPVIFSTPAPALPQTGDSMNFALLALLTAAGMIGMAMLLRRKKA